MIYSHSNHYSLFHIFWVNELLHSSYEILTSIIFLYYSVNLLYGSCPQRPTIFPPIALRLAVICFPICLAFSIGTCKKQKNIKYCRVRSRMIDIRISAQVSEYVINLDKMYYMKIYFLTTILSLIKHGWKNFIVK